MKKYSLGVAKSTIITLVFLFSIIVIGRQTVYAAPDFSGAYVKEHPNISCYYDQLDGKTIVFNDYDSEAELFKGERQPYNFYELAYWNPDTDPFISAESSNTSVARVYDQMELYGDGNDDGYYTAIIEARKKGTAIITVTESEENEPDIVYDDYGNEEIVYVPPTIKTYKFKVVVTDKWYSGRLHYSTIIRHPNIYPKTKKTKFTFKNLRKDDKVTIKIGKNRAITKKIKKDTKRISYKIKFKKQPAGRNINVTVTDKYGRKVKSSCKPIYYTSKIKKGLTKKQVKLVPGWGSPEHTNVNGKITIWWYNNYAKYIKFKNRKVIGWGK